MEMYAVTGITGKVGSTVAHDPLAAGRKVRAVVRDAAKGKPWAAKGCQVAIAEIGDAASQCRRRRGRDCGGPPAQDCIPVDGRRAAD